MTGPGRQILAEELIRSVDEVDAHRPSLSYGANRAQKWQTGHIEYTRTVPAPKLKLVGRGRQIRESGVDSAALAYSLLPLRFADAINDHLTVSERQALREATARVREASDQARMEAIRALVASVRRGVVFPRPAAHDDDDCPFAPVANHPRARVVEVLERVARRDGLEVVVTLCHLREEIRQELWDGLAPETRALLLPRLDQVHLTSASTSREFARDVNARLARAAIGR
jgi:hypothetical protein